METVMLIGCNGLIGTNLTQKLLERGYTVIGYSRNKSKVIHPNFHFYGGELYELTNLIRIMKRHNVDTVVHNAALSHPKMAADDPYRMFMINLNGVLNTIEAASVAGIKRYIFSSAAGVYGNNISNPIYEDAPLKSECAYDSAKIAAEEVVKNYGIECAILRIGFVYGPNRIHECPIAMLINELLSKEDVNWDSGKDQLLDYIYIDDAVDGFIGAVSSPKLNYKIYNLGGGCMTPFSNVIDIVQKLYPDKTINIGSGGLGYDNIGRMDNSRAFEDFKYMPKITLEEGIQKYNKWIISQRENS